ncbi:MAG: aspartate 1-decarboxylase autocleavage activator PanM [Psychromonas sp.]|nr:aspartate 1-decarboxylase autocleavage activator PanM [Psychromonas sp.]
MRLSVFSPEISPQLIIDLQKLYQEYLSPQALSESSLQSLINTPNKQFFVTLFNDRHLGAVQVTTENSIAQLSLLCVRDITRRRGVGKNLIREVEKQLIDQGISTVNLQLTDITDVEQEGMKLFMQSCGYQFANSQLTKSL